MKMAGIQSDPSTARIAGISLETYVELHKALTKGHGNLVAQFNSMEEAWFKIKDLQQLLAMHGLTDGARKKKELLSKMQGMELYTPIPDFSNPLQIGNVEGNRNNSPQDNAEHQQQQGLDCQASTQQPAARVSGKATNKATGNNSTNHVSKQPRITAFFPTPTPAKQPTPSRGIDDITAADLAVLGWCDVNEDVEAALKQPAMKFQAVNSEPDADDGVQQHPPQQQQLLLQGNQVQQQQRLKCLDNNQSTSVVTQRQEPCGDFGGAQLHAQIGHHTQPPSQAINAAVHSQHMLFTQPAAIIASDQGQQQQVSERLPHSASLNHHHNSTVTERQVSGCHNLGINVSAAAGTAANARVTSLNPTPMMPSAHMPIPNVEQTLAYAMQWLQQQQQHQSMHHTTHAQTYSATAPHSLTQQRNIPVMPTQATPMNVAAFATQATTANTRMTDGTVVGCVADEGNEAGSLKWLAAEVLKFSQEAGVTVSNEQVEPCKLLGRRVGFLLLNPVDHLGKGGRVEGTLPAGLHQGAVVRRIGSACKPDLCDASCQGCHEWCSVRVMTHLSIPNARLELTLDLSPSHRLTDLHQILGLAGHHTRLQDAWLLLQIRAAGHPDTDDDDDDTISISSRATASRGAVKPGRGRGRKRPAPM